jgi:hypothetical protein
MKKHKMPGVTIAIYRITPDDAQLLLSKESLSLQRSKKPKMIEKIANAILTDNWLFTGETIIISDTGKLLDGQNRLNACLRSGREIISVVVRGVDERVFVALGDSKARTNADRFGIAGEKNRNVLASAVSFLHKYLSDATSNDFHQGTSPSPHEAFRVLGDHPNIRESVEKAMPCRAIVSPGLMAFIHYIGSWQMPEAADQFLEAVARGENLPPTSSALWLRNKIISARKRDNKMSRRAVVACAISAWNAFLTGEPVENWRKGQAMPDFRELTELAAE